MDKRSIATSMAPEVIIEQVEGDLQVKGWDRPEVAVFADLDELVLTEEEDGIRLNCTGDCDVRLPQGASLQVDSVLGDAHLKLLEDHLAMDQIQGALALHGVGPTTIETVHGDLWIKGVAGDLVVRQVHGNATVRSVEGRCILEEVMGNLDLRSVEGEVKVSTQGNARIRLNELGGNSYQFQVDGNLHCLIPEDSSVKLDLTSEGNMIRLRLPDGMQNIQEEHHELTLGDGQIAMSMSAGGAIYLFCEETSSTGEGEAGVTKSFADLDQRITQQFEAQIQLQMENMTRQITEQMERAAEQIGRIGLSPERTEEIMERARHASERGAARAEEKIRRAQEKLERKLEVARRREEGRRQGGETRPGRGWKFEWSIPPKPPVNPKPSVPPPGQQVSEEERLMILKMLEQKKITIEEAENLLSTLES
jgi:hypothetical protein